MPSGTSPPRRVVVGFVLLFVLVGGAVGLGVLLQEPTDKPPVGANASERFSALDGVTATVTTTVERGNRTNRTVRRVELRPGTGAIRAEKLSGPSAGPEVLVSNGTTRWAYDRDARTVRRTTASNLTDRLTHRGAQIERLFLRAAGAERTAESRSARTPGVSPLPAVPYGRERTATPTGGNSTDSYEVSYNGTATVAGRDVHVLHIESRTDAGTAYADVSQTLWVDAEWFVPLRYRTHWTDDGTAVTATTEYANVSLDTSLDDERFEFEVPADAALVTPDLGADAAARIDTVESFGATVTSRTAGFDFNGSETAENGTYRSVQRVSQRPGTGQQRIEMVEQTAVTNGSGVDLIVSNGSVTWLYDREANNVTILQSGSQGTYEQRGDQIARLFAQLNRTRTELDEEDQRPGLALSPVTGSSGVGGVPVPSLPGNQSSNRFGVSFGGVELVDGRPAYVIAVKPTGGDNNSGPLGNYSRQIWVDAETFLPLQYHTSFTTDGDQVTTTVTYSNVTINPGFEDSLFEFDPPADANISRLDSSLGASYESRSALAADAPVAVPDPSVPDDFEFSVGRTSETSFADSVSLVYTNETSRLTVSVFELNESDRNGSLNMTGEPVHIDGSNGTYSEAGLYGSVSWACSGRRYSVSGSGVSKPLLVEIAESVGCP